MAWEAREKATFSLKDLFVLSRIEMPTFRSSAISPTHAIISFFANSGL